MSHTVTTTTKCQDAILTVVAWCCVFRENVSIFYWVLTCILRDVLLDSKVIETKTLKSSYWKYRIVLRRVWFQVYIILNFWSFDHWTKMTLASAFEHKKSAKHEDIWIKHAKATRYSAPTKAPTHSPPPSEMLPSDNLNIFFRIKSRHSR